MNRRDILVLGCTLLAEPALAFAQAKPRPRWRVGWPGIGHRAASGECIRNWRQETFLDGLKDLGYVEGLHFTLDFRCLERRPERLPDVAREMITAKVDVIVAVGNDHIAAARAASGRIPIVMPIERPVKTDLVVDLKFARNLGIKIPQSIPLRADRVIE